MYENNQAFVDKLTICDKLYYNNTLILTYEINYPKIISSTYPDAAFRISQYYKICADMTKEYCVNQLYAMAIKQYEHSIANGFKPVAFDVTTDFEVTYNQNRILSLYTDRYVYGGGAHGNTKRTAETWDMQSGTKVTMEMLFPDNSDYESYVKKQVIAQIKKQMKEGNAYYFDDYVENVNNTFNVNNFFLTDKGMAVYFQQYDIAPYSSGIPVFIIGWTLKRGKKRC